MGFQKSNRTGASSTQTSADDRETGSVSVEIRGQKLNVRSDKDPEFVRELAGYVDDKVATLQDAAPAVPLEKLLMLASMTIAEELFESQKQVDRLRSTITDRVEKCLEVIDDAESELK